MSTSTYTTSKVFSNFNANSPLCIKCSTSRGARRRTENAMRAVIEQAAQGCRTRGMRLETIQGSSLGGLMEVTAMTHSIMKV